jgi:hypothetical protein
MPRILPEPDLDKYEWVVVPRLGTTGVLLSDRVRVLRRKPDPVPDPD